jgi:ABC-type nitrate/sulfonate/bicarbonate transport system substrate-binding protein
MREAETRKPEETEMKKAWRFIRAAGLMLLVTGLLGGQALAAQKVTYVMSWIPDARWAPEIVAKYRGYFKAAGLDVALKWVKGSRNAGKTVATGAAEFGAPTAGVVLTGREKGLPLVSVLQTNRKTQISFVSLKKSGIKSPKDFYGKKVGVQRGSATWVGFLALTGKYGIDIDKLNKINVGFGLKPLLTGMVDVRPAYIANEVVQAKMKGIDLNVIWISDHGIEQIGNGTATNETFLKSNPKAVRSFVQASIKGWKHSVKDPDDALKAILQHKPDHDPAFQKQALVIIQEKISVAPKGHPWGWSVHEEWQTTHDNLVEYGVIKKPLDVRKAYTNQFIKE